MSTKQDSSRNPTEPTGIVKRIAQCETDLYEPCRMRDDGFSDSGADQRDHTPVVRPRSYGGLWKAAVLVALLCGPLAWWFAMESPRRERVAEEALSDAHKTAEKRHQIDAILTKARASLARKQWKEGQARFEEVLLLDPASQEALLGIVKIKEHLANARGGLIIKTEPPGATVQVGGSAVERTPARIKELRLGQYPVRIELDGYEPVLTEFEVKENEFTDSGVIELVRGKGALKITSIPSGQGFELRDAFDQKRYGTTPAALNDLPTGRYHIRFWRVGWPDHVARAVVARNETTVVGYEFGIGELTIESDPPGGTISVNGVEYGSTPLKAELPIGYYAIVGSYPDCPDVHAVAKLENGHAGTVKIAFDIQAARKVQQARESKRQAQRAAEERAAMAAAENHRLQEKALRRVNVEEMINILAISLESCRQVRAQDRAAINDPSYQASYRRALRDAAPSEDAAVAEMEARLRSLQQKLETGDY